MIITEAISLVESNDSPIQLHNTFLWADLAHMDPLSLTASLIAVIGLGGKTITSLAKIRAAIHAKDEVSVLINEITDLQATLTTISHTTQEEDHNDHHLGPKKALASHVQRAKDKILELQELIAYRLAGPDGNIKAVRLAWLRERHVVLRLQSELRSIRWNLATSLGMVTSSSVSRVELTIQRIFCDQQALSAQLASLLAREPSTVPQGTLFDMDNHRPPIPHRLFPDSSIARLDIGAHGEPATSINVSDDTIRRTIVVRTSTVVNKKSCNAWCSCVCHVRRAIRTPAPIRNIFGALFVGYSGLPVLTPSCTERGCRNRANPAIQLDYHFPSWFLARALAISISMSSAIGIEGTLRVPRMVAWSSPIWRMARTGQLNTIQKMFFEGKASPFDVNAYGQSALHYATAYRQFEVCKFLIGQGALPSLADENKVTPTDSAWNLILSKDLVPEQAREVSEMFADDEFMESRQFTALHKVTLNIITSRTVISELEITTSALNSMDASKRTPLSWAVARRDCLTAGVLLDYGADPNLVDSERRPPLYYAIKNGDIPSVELMLSHGARTDLRDAFGGTALHIACKNQDKVQLLDAIMAKTQEINMIDDDGDTPLMYAARRNNWKSVAYLISRGAALDLVNVAGDSAAGHAIINHSYDVVRELLRAGASTDLKNNQGHTITDMALQSGHPQIMELFRVDTFYDAVQEQNTEDH